MNNEQNNQPSPYLIPLAIIVAGVLVAGGIFFSSNPVGTKQAIDNQAPTAIEITSEGNPFIGDPNAPLTLYYWSDWQCPFCKQFENTTEQSLVTEYVDKGKVKIVFKDLQFLGQDSFDSALIARAIWDLYPDKYYSWREGYFELQDEEQDIGFGDQESVLAYSKTISGIDTDKVLAAVNDNAAEYQQKIQADGAQGSANGIGGTPGLIVGSAQASNPLNYPAVKALVDSQL